MQPVGTPVIGNGESLAKVRSSLGVNTVIDKGDISDPPVHAVGPTYNRSAGYRHADPCGVIESHWTIQATRRVHSQVVVSNQEMLLRQLPGDAERGVSANEIADRVVFVGSVEKSALRLLAPSISHTPFSVAGAH